MAGRKVFSNFALILELAKREVEERYTNQVLGILWVLLHPAVLIGVYIFLFVVVFKVKIGGTRELPLDYTTYLICGLAPWLVMLEGLNKSGTTITGASNLVKQIVFPVEILPVKTILATIPSYVVSLGILVTYIVITQEVVHKTIIFLPILFALQYIFMIGLCFIISSLGVFFRDLKDIVQVTSFVAMYMMPLFYLPNAVPGGFKFILYVNPFSYMIWSYQDALYFGDFRHWWALFIFAFLSLSTLVLGYRLFMNLKPVFADAL